MKTIALPLLLCSLAAPPAAAEPVVRGGIAVDSLTPDGLARLSIEAPAAPGRPVRLVFGTNDRPEVLLDVLVAPDAAAARAALDDWRRTVVHPPPAEDLGDVGYGRGCLHAFARDNVFVAVRRVEGTVDAEAHARAIDAAIQAAPSGDPVAPAIAAQTFADGQAGDDPIPVAVPEGMLAVRLDVDGPAYPRNTRAGWVVVRTGPGPVTVRLFGTDDHLRPTP